MAYLLREQAEGLVAPLLTQVIHVILEKLACFRRLTITMFQEFLGPPAMHGIE